MNISEPGPILHAEVLLRSLPGAVEFLREDLAAVATAVIRRAGADYLVVRVDGPAGALRPLQSYASFGLLLGSDQQPLSRILPQRLAALADQLAALTGVGSSRPAFRVDATVPDRPAVIEAVTGALGWPNTPDRWDLNLTVHDRQVVAEVGEWFLTRRLGELARVPASTTPIVADVLVRLAAIQPGQLVLDSFCGAATILLTAARHADRLRLIGIDRDRRALAAARHNLRARAVTGTLLEADARRLPLPDQRVDRIVANLPFGKRVGSHRGNAQLYPAFLREAERVLAPGGRMVLLSEDKTLLRQAVRRTRRIKVARELLLRTGGATPTGFVVVRSRRPRPTGER